MGNRKGDYGETHHKVLRLLKYYTKYTGGLPSFGILSDIAKDVGVSRERVRQIMVKSGLFTPTRKIVHKKLCIVCNKEFESRNKGHLCCSPECHKKYVHEKYWTTFTCEICKKKKEVRRSIVRNLGTPRFCSKSCQGLWLGRSRKGKTGYIRSPYLKNPRAVADRLPERFTVKDIMKEFSLGNLTAYFMALSLVKHGRVKFVRRGRGATPHLFTFIDTTPVQSNPHSSVADGEGEGK